MLKKVMLFKILQEVIVIRFCWIFVWKKHRKKKICIGNFLLLICILEKK